MVDNRFMLETGIQRPPLIAALVSLAACVPTDRITPAASGGAPESALAVTFPNSSERLSPLDDIAIEFSAAVSPGALGAAQVTSEGQALEVEVLAGATPTSALIRPRVAWRPGATLEVNVYGAMSGAGASFPSAASTRKVRTTRVARQFARSAAAGISKTCFFEYDAQERPICSSCFEGELSEPGGTPLEGVRAVYGQDGSYEWFLSGSPGGDDTFCTADDAPLSGYGVARTVGERHERFYAEAPGADDRWLTTDDVNASASFLQTLPTDARLTCAVHGTGADGTYLTADDTLSCRRCEMPTQQVGEVIRTIFTDGSCDASLATEYCDRARVSTRDVLTCYKMRAQGKPEPMVDIIFTLEITAFSQRGQELSKRLLWTGEDQRLGTADDTTVFLDNLLYDSSGNLSAVVHTWKPGTNDELVSLRTVHELSP